MINLRLSSSAFAAIAIIGGLSAAGCRTLSTAAPLNPKLSSSRLCMGEPEAKPKDESRDVRIRLRKSPSSNVAMADNSAISLASTFEPASKPEATTAFDDQTFDLETLVALAIASNPAVEQAKAAAAQASGIQHQVGLRPNPTFGYFGQEIGNEGSGGQHGAFASQTFIRGDKLALNQCVVAQDVKRLRWLVESQRRRLETDIHIQFYRALAAQQKLRQAQAFRIDAAKAVDIAERRLAAEEGAKPDLLQSQLLVDQIDLSIQKSELEWLASWAQLAATIGQPSLQASELRGEFVAADMTDFEVLFEQIVSVSPHIKAAAARIDRAKANLKRQRNQVVPNLNIQVGVGVDDSTDDSFANVQLGLPVPIHNRNQGNISSAQAEYIAGCKNLQRLKLQIRRDLADLYRQYQTAAIAVASYEQDMLPRAEESLSLVEKARNAGEVEFLRVLTARQTLFDLQQLLISARGELSQADAKIKGFLLMDSLGTEVGFDGDDGLRGQALGGQ